MQQKKNKSQITDHFLVIGCNEPYSSYDSIFGGHLLDVITCKKCGKVNINCIEKIYLIILFQSLMKIEPFLGLLLPLTDRVKQIKELFYYLKKYFVWKIDFTIRKLS